MLFFLGCGGDNTPKKQPKKEVPKKVKTPKTGDNKTKPGDNKTKPGDGKTKSGDNKTKSGDNKTN